MNLAKREKRIDQITGKYLFDCTRRFALLNHQAAEGSPGIFLISGLRGRNAEIVAEFTFDMLPNQARSSYPPVLDLIFFGARVN